MNAGMFSATGAESVSDECNGVSQHRARKGLAADFQRAFQQCEDPTHRNPVSLIVSNVLERVSAGIPKDRACDEVFGMVEFAKVSNPDKFALVMKAARIGLGLESSGIKIPEDVFAKPKASP